MTKDLWLSLPSRDLAASKAFFEALGFAFNEAQTNEHSVCLMIGSKPTIVMLFPEATFSRFTGIPVSDTLQGAEMLISIDAESREEVDELANRARNAGGLVFGEPGESQGWMYGCGFTDPDGHRWNVLYMDREKMGN